MVEKIYIVWCRLNKNTAKFDLGVFIDKTIADTTAENYKSEKSIYPELWVSEYKLSKQIPWWGT